MIASIGMPLAHLQAIVIIGILVLVVGYILVAFWQQIVIGIAAIGCIIILCASDGTETTKAPVQKISPDKKMFLQDCVNMTEYTLKQCDNIWEDRSGDEEIVLKSKDE